MGNTITSLSSTLSQAVDAVQKGIVDTQEQLASGKATLNAAETGVVSRLTAQVAGYGSVTKNLTDAGSAIDVAQSALSSISEIMSQLKGLAVQASSAGFASSDRDSLNLTFKNLTNQIQQLVTSASVNGANLINTDFGLQVTTGIDGTADSQTQIHATNVNELVQALNQLLITGLQIADKSYSAVDLAQPTSAITSAADTTVAANFASPATSTPTLTFPQLGLKAGDSFSITSGLNTLKLTLTSNMTAVQLASAFADKLGPGTNTSYGNWTYTGDPTFTTGKTGTSINLASNTVAGERTSTLRLGFTGNQEAGSQTYAITSGTQTQTITFPNAPMVEGTSITIGNTTFTAGPGPSATSAGISPQQVSAAFVGFVNNGVQPDPSIGKFTTTTDAVAQVENVKCHEIKSGEYFAAGGLKFYATTDITAVQVANAFLQRIANPNANFSYGFFGSGPTTPTTPGTIGNGNTITTGLGSAVNAGGSTSTIAWSYDPAGVPTSRLLDSAAYSVIGISNPAIVVIAKNGLNANTGTEITGGSAFGNSAVLLSSNSISLTTGEPLTTGSTPTIAGVEGVSLLSSVGNTTLRNTLTFSNTDLLTGTANLFLGDSVTINGLTFTATQNTTPQQVLDAFKNVINTGDTGNLYGIFSNTDVGGGSLTGKVSEFTNYFKAIDLGNNVLAIDNKADNTSTASLNISWNTQNAAISNSNKATQIITGQIDTISTAQASLAAATAGIDAQLKNATNIKNGVQKTVDAISNINPTALQAQLQEFNTQQSVDYYLVSQMNTAAAAILSIFR